MKKLVLASNNANKLREIRQLLAPLQIEVLSQKEAGCCIEPEETGTTFAENAALKAHAVYEICRCAVLADDSGLTVDALNGQPGVYSHRWAGENATDAQRCEKLLDAMQPHSNRKAQFVCALCYLDESGTEHCFSGSVEGEIGMAPAGENGFGYDPIFYWGNQSFAEISAEEKNKISHRANALRAFVNWLSEQEAGCR